MRDSTDSGTLNRSGSGIRYWLSGPKDGPLVAFTPGATMDHRMFDRQVEAATDAGYRALTWDVRGHGLSKPIGHEFTNGSVAEDLAALVPYVGYEKAVLVGQSFGGYVSQELYLRHPERVSALIVIGSTCLTVPPTRLQRLALKSTRALFKALPDKTRISVAAKLDFSHL